jgi:hypothetical protein
MRPPLPKAESSLWNTACIGGEFINERQDRAAVDDKPLARFGIGDMLRLFGRYVQLFHEDFPVARRLIEKIQKIAVFKVRLSRVFVQNPKNILPNRQIFIRLLLLPRLFKPA